MHADDDMNKVIKQLSTAAASSNRKKRKKWIKNQGPSTWHPVTPGIPMPGLK